MASSPSQSLMQLVVEGKNDQHVIWGLCEKYQLPKVFKIVVPGENNSGGIDTLLEDIPVRLKTKGLKVLGIIVDADQNLQSRWESISERLLGFGYTDLPRIPPSDGFVHAPFGKPKIGIWLMPDNQLPGMLETFVSYLIPDEDGLRPKVEAFLHEIEQAELNKYSLVHHQKAFIHAWLACQKTPGQPMGQAITANALQFDQPLSKLFITWINRLFVVNDEHSL